MDLSGISMDIESEYIVSFQCLLLGQIFLSEVT